MVEQEVTTINVSSKQKLHGLTHLLSFLCSPDASAASARWEHMLIKRQPSPKFCRELHVKHAAISWTGFVRDSYTPKYQQIRRRYKGIQSLETARTTTLTLQRRTRNWYTQANRSHMYSHLLACKQKWEWPTKTTARWKGTVAKEVAKETLARPPVMPLYINRLTKIWQLQVPDSIQGCPWS